MQIRSKQWLSAVLGLLVVVGALVGVKAGQIGLMIASGKSSRPAARVGHLGGGAGLRVAALEPGHRQRGGGARRDPGRGAARDGA